MPFSPKIIKTALESYEWHENGDWIYNDGIYAKLGYLTMGKTALLIPQPKPWETKSRSIKSILGGL